MNDKLGNVHEPARDTAQVAARCVTLVTSMIGLMRPKTEGEVKAALSLAEVLVQAEIDIYVRHLADSAEGLVSAKLEG